MKVPEEVEYLFKPITIGDVDLANRIMVSPMATGYANKGYVTDRMVDYYAERSKGKPGSVIVEMAIIDYPIGATSGPLMLSSDDDKFIPGLKRVADAIKREDDVSAMIELSHGGRYCHSRLTGIQPVAPSAVASQLPGLSEMPRALSTNEVEEIIEKFGDAAVRCSEAGFEGVELMGSTGYLISQFTSPLINLRTDRFGGKTPAERATFICAIIKNIRKKLGNLYPILYKISAEDFIPNGVILEDAMVIAKKAEVAGASVIHTWAGFHESPKPMLPMSVPRGAFVYLAEAMKTVINVPVMTGGRINDPRLANEIIRDGKADLVFFGRAFFSDPYFPLKAMRGDFEDIRMCVACCRCFDCAARLRPIHCAVNAEVGFEGNKVKAADTPKKILIIGGGPAGMEAARVAAERGHNVTLWEKTDKLGGNLLLASVAPHKEEMQCITDYLTYQMKKLNINVELGKEATVESIIDVNADEVIIATGALVDIPEIPGLDRSNVIIGLDVLSGKADTGQKVVVLGGGMIGCEVSEFLTSMGKDVSIVEMSSRLAQDIGPSSRWDVVKRIRRWGIELFLGYEAKQIEEEGVLIEGREGSRTLKADTIIIALGMKPNNSLYESLKEKISNLHHIGDCVEPARMLEAIHGGYNINRKF